MKPNVFDTSMWGLIWQSDFMTKLVLLILFVFSILCWAIALYKFILLRIKKAQCKSMVQTLESVQNFQDIHTLAQGKMHTLPGFFLAQLLGVVKKLLMHQKQYKVGVENYTSLLQDQVGYIFEEIISVEESYISFLSMSSAVAPLLGLFGTVWGLIHSFLQIAQEQSADIVTVAPGISEALITTVVGLMVAIPALLLFYYLQLQVRNLEQQLIAIIDKTVFITQLFLVQQQVNSSSFQEISESSEGLL